MPMISLGMTGNNGCKFDLVTTREIMIESSITSNDTIAGQVYLLLDNYLSN